jgi:XTP/dITP diphosphohydrolase|tara:strand:+ start:2045 stop:2650 length:606 start_codon:yes stop_codon:yes gene_type:complete
MVKKKITNLLIGSNNQGKIKEIREILPKSIKIYSTKDFKNIKSPHENGKTFAENSLLKARYYSKKTKMTCLADDSGLEINILNNEPGIFSARWGGKKSDFNLAIKKVYKKLYSKNKKWKSKKIKARFVCALTLYWSEKKYKTRIGYVYGSISKKKLGNRGFGYDPIFIPSRFKKTFGQMNFNKKKRIDHRFKAFQKIKKFF